MGTSKNSLLLEMQYPRLHPESAESEFGILTRFLDDSHLSLRSVDIRAMRLYPTLSLTKTKKSLLF